MVRTRLDLPNSPSTCGPKFRRFCAPERHLTICCRAAKAQGGARLFTPRFSPPPRLLLLLAQTFPRSSRALVPVCRVEWRAQTARASADCTERSVARAFRLSPLIRFGLTSASCLPLARTSFLLASQPARSCRLQDDAPHSHRSGCCLDRYLRVCTPHPSSWLTILPSVLAVPAPPINAATTVVDAFRALRSNSLANDSGFAKRQSTTDIINGLQDLLEKAMDSQQSSSGKCHDECAGWFGLIEVSRLFLFLERGNG